MRHPNKISRSRPRRTPTCGSAWVASWIDGSVKEELVWYQTYATERAANSSYRIGWKVPLNRLAFDVGGTYANVRDRPGYEIDARSLRIETRVNGSVEVRTLSKTFFGARAERQRTNFDKDAVFLASNLHAGAGSRHDHRRILRQTSADAVDVGDRSPRRGYRTGSISRPCGIPIRTSATVTLTFDPFALIKGSADRGLSRFSSHFRRAC